MKRNYLIYIFVILGVFFIGNIRVSAARELKCVYTYYESAEKKSGEPFYKLTDPHIVEYNQQENTGWYVTNDGNIANNWHSNFYDELGNEVEAGKLDECKNYMIIRKDKFITDWGNADEFYFTDENVYDITNYRECGESCFIARLDLDTTKTETYTQEEVNYQTSCANVNWEASMQELKEKYASNPWEVMCIYGRDKDNKTECAVITFMFNSKASLGKNQDEIQDINDKTDCSSATCYPEYRDEFYYDYGICPYMVYKWSKYIASETVDVYSEDYYMDEHYYSFYPKYAPKCGEGLNFFGKLANCNQVSYLKNTYKLKISNDVLNKSLIEYGNKIDADTCGELVPAAIINKLNEFMKWVRIIIPILIIGLGIMDFAQAVLASDEDKMKKAQAKFIKRLIIGLIIFLIPTFINLLLNIANDVWGVVGKGTCGIK